MERKTIRIATRKSELALWQANAVSDLLREAHSHLDTKIITFTTEGDKLLEQPLATAGGKGLFTKELEAALLTDRADIAVHSMKDVPMELPKGLCIKIICERGDPRDAFVSNQYNSLADMPDDATVGTSSLRRQCLIKTRFPKLKTENCRGNVPSRCQKLDDGQYDAIILAAAGLQRLNMADRIKECLPVNDYIPAVGQAAIGIECRESDNDLIRLLNVINCEQSYACVMAERAVNQKLFGGCQVPIGIHATRHGATISLRAMVGHPNGSIMIKSQLSGHINNALQIGQSVADDLCYQGAKKIIADVYRDYS